MTAHGTKGTSVHALNLWNEFVITTCIMHRFDVLEGRESEIVRSEGSRLEG